MSCHTEFYPEVILKEMENDPFWVPILEKSQLFPWNDKKTLDILKKQLCCHLICKSIVMDPKIQGVINSYKADYTKMPNIFCDRLDAFWHLTLTFTKQYREFCKKYLGFVIEHDPCNSESFQGLSQKDTMASYYGIFGKMFIDEIFEVKKSGSTIFDSTSIPMTEEDEYHQHPVGFSGQCG